jgi:hypothetical protein
VHAYGDALEFGAAQLFVSAYTVRYKFGVGFRWGMLEK